MTTQLSVRKLFADAIRADAIHVNRGEWYIQLENGRADLIESDTPEGQEEFAVALAKGNRCYAFKGMDENFAPNLIAAAKSLYKTGEVIQIKDVQTTNENEIQLRKKYADAVRFKATKEGASNTKIHLAYSDLEPWSGTMSQAADEIEKGTKFGLAIYARHSLENN